MNTAPTPPNDNFLQAIPLEGFAVSTTGSSVGATRESAEPNHGGFSARSFHLVEMDARRQRTGALDTSDSPFDTVLAVYTGSSLTNLLAVASNDDAADGGSTSKVDFNAVAGMTYFVSVDGFAGASGDVHLNLVSTQPQALQIGDIQRTQDGHISFAVRGASTQLFILQTSTDLVHWESVSTNQCINSVFNFDESPTSGPAAKFYRIAPWP